MEILRIASTAATVQDACKGRKRLQCQWDVDARAASLAGDNLDGSLARRLRSIGVTRATLREIGAALVADGREMEARAKISDLWQSVPYKVDVNLRSAILVEKVWSDVWESFKERMTPRGGQTRRELFGLPKRPLPDAPSRVWAASCMICKGIRIDRLGRELDAFALDRKRNLTRPAASTSVQDRYFRANGPTSNGKITVEQRATFLAPTFPGSGPRDPKRNFVKNRLREIRLACGLTQLEITSSSRSRSSTTRRSRGTPCAPTQFYSTVRGIGSRRSVWRESASGSAFPATPAAACSKNSSTPTISPTGRRLTGAALSTNCLPIAPLLPVPIARMPPVYRRAVAKTRRTRCKYAPRPVARMPPYLNLVI
jgi:hypothetical protein